MRWALNLSNLWQMLVEVRGSTPERYEQLIADVARSQLLGSDRLKPPT